MRVLVVDDSSDIRNLMKYILSDNKYEVETAENGADALNKYSKFKPDIVTLDITMPVMDGVETLSKLLKLDKHANIIMTTAHEENELILRCLQRGAIGYIVKPFTKEHLLTSIANALRTSEHKTVNTLFALISDRIEESIAKIVEEPVSVTLKDLQVMKQEESTQMFSSTQDLSRIRSVGQIIQPLEIGAPEGACGYVSQISGQGNGKIVSFIKVADLGKECNSSELIECFNIINSKVISMMANFTHLTLYMEPTRLYDKTKDINPSTREITKARFEVTHRKGSTLLEIQACFDLEFVFRSRF